MKRAVKWTSTDVDPRPGRKEQAGRCRPRKGLWRRRQPLAVNIDLIHCLFHGRRQAALFLIVLHFTFIHFLVFPCIFQWVWYFRMV